METTESSAKKITEIVVATALVVVWALSAFALMYNVPERKFERYVASAQSSAQAEDYEAAEGFYEKALALYPDDINCIVSLADVYFADGKDTEAEQMYENLFSLVDYGSDPDYFNANYLTAYKNYLKLTDRAVVWQDKTFEAQIRAYLNKPEGDITRSELDKIAEITAYGDSWYIYTLGEAHVTPDVPAEIESLQGGVTSLKDLENFVGLKYIRLSAQSLTKTDCDLSLLLGLEVFDVSYNDITDITGVENLTQIKKLYLQHNLIGDCTAVGNLIQLETLYLSFNKLTFLTPLSNLVNLKGLGLTDNGLTDISAIAPLTSLTGLGLAMNCISDLTPLSNMTALEGLGLNYNAITDLTPLSALVSLKDLGLRQNMIDDVTPLTSLTALISLDLGENKIVDASPLNALKNLETLWLDKNPLFIPE